MIPENFAQIVTCVSPVEKWNPTKSETVTSFKYIDLSSVDKEAKVVDLTLVEEIRSNKAPSRARQKVKKGDILVATVRPNLNGVAIVPVSLDGATASTGYCVLRPIKELIDTNYLFHWLKTDTFISKMMRLATGANYPAVSDKIVKSSKIPLPPLEEQKRIAAILDKADAIRGKRQQAIDLADQFLRSVFLELFGDPVTNPKGWDIETLSGLAEIRSGVTKGRNLHGKKTVHVPYMRVANVQDGKICLEDVAEIEVLDSDVLKYQLEKGDILLTEGGDPDKLGRGAVWKGEIASCIHQNHIFSVRADKTIIHPEYLSAQIGSQRGKRYFLKYGKQTTGIATINKTVLSDYPVLIPPIELQEEYVRIFEFTKTIIDRELVSKRKLDMNFDSISQSAFNGSLAQKKVA